MMRNLLLLSLVFVMLTGKLIAQTAPIDGQIIKQSQPAPVTPTTLNEITPGGFFDNLYDNFGNVYSYNDLTIKLTPDGPGPEIQSVMTCTAGYFRAFFANGSGFELNNPIHNARRAVVCEVLNNLAGFVNQSFAVAGSTVYVNILFDNIANLYPTPGNPGAPLGGCSPIYCMPNGPSSLNPGVIDNLVYKTIITEQDGYTNVGAPLFSPGNGGGFYHALAAFNFVNPGYTWHTNMAVPCAPEDENLYTVILHEMTHALGFGTLISSTGVSFFGASNNYYTRYDTYLRTSGGSPLLSATGACVPAYGLAFTAPVSVLGPGACPSSPPLTTNCGTAIRYVSPLLPNMPVYNPSCFESGKTISHFEDMCYPTSNPANNDLYFVMSDGGPPGSTKRYLKEEERSVLCDLGYTTSNSYTSSAFAAPNNYTAATCTPPNIWGVNDGLPGGVYTYTSTGTPVNIAISGGTASILYNDAPTAITATCVESVYFNGVVSVSGNIITFVPNPGYSGAFCLRYIPVDNLGNQGNITYIIGYIYSASCNISSTCDLLPNGTYEATQGNCGVFSTLTHPNCWFTNTGSPDLFVRNCTQQTVYNLGNNTYFMNPVVNNHAGPPSPNNALVGLTSNVSTITTNNAAESVWSRMVTPLVPGQVYNLSFWLYQKQGLMTSSPPNLITTSVNPISVPLVLTVGSRFTANTCVGCQYPEPGTIPLASLTPPNIYNTWLPYNLTFTYTNGTPMQFFEIGINYLLTANNVTNTPGTGSYLTSGYAHYVFIDDVSLKVASSVPTFTPPNLCYGGSLSDLSQFAYPPIPNAVFTGSGVVNNGGVYSFNAAPNNTLLPGTYPVTMSYTNNLGCPVYVNAAITITTVPPPFNFTLNPAYCQNTGISNMSVCITPTAYANCGTFAGTGIYTFPNPPCTGYGLTLPLVPGNLGLQTYTYTYPNLVLTNTAVPGGTLSCTAFATATTIVIPAITLSINVTPTGSCVPFGQSATLTALSNYSNNTYTWMPGPQSGSSIVVSPTATTLYTVTADNGTCSVSNTVIVNVTPLPQFTNTPLTLCTGQFIYYLENWLAPGTPTGGIWTAPFITSPTGTPGLTAGYLNPTITPVGTQTISYTYSTTPGCFASNQFTVNIVPGFVINTNGMSTYCSNLGIGALLDATATPSANVSYTWIPGNLVGATQTVAPGSPTTYTVIATNTVNGCQFEGTTFVDVRNDCCAGANYISAAVISNTFLTGQWAINQNVTVTGSVSLQGEFIIAPNVTITVAPGATLSTDRNGAHLYSCGNMWWGINVMNGGYCWFDGYNVVEDAREAFSSTGSTNTSTVSPTILIRTTTLNRNYYGLAIHNYVVPTNSSPFVVQNSLFTCRDLSITPGSLNLLQWASATAPVLLASNGTSVLASPYLVGNCTPANMKAPYGNRASFAGVYIENSGVSINPANPLPTYFTIFVGDVDDKNTTYLLFDNLLHGIYGRNSNFRSRNNVFQNTRRFNPGGPPTNLIGGIGIFGINDNAYGNGSNYISTVDPVNTVAMKNYFYDCHFGIHVQNIHELNAQYDDYRSTQANPGPSGPLVKGQFAIWIYSNRFKNYQINNNKIQNINTGVYIAAYPAPINLPPLTFNFGTYFDRIFVTNNFFCPALSPVAPAGTGYINYCVYAVSGISGFSHLNTFYTPSAQLRISTNTMNRVWRGSYVSNFSNSAFTAFTANNNISMVEVPNPPQSQHGIEHLVNNADVVNTNTIVGTAGTFSNSNLVGVYRSMNSSGSTQCNSVTSVYAGFEFAGANVGAFWRNNVMNTSHRGLQLTNNAILSVQGSSITPSDNLWQGNNWSFPNNLQTWTDLLTFAANSKLYRRTISGYDPIISTGQAPPNSYANPANLLLSSNNAPFAACLPGGGGGCNNCNPGILSSLESIVQDSVQYLGNVNATSEINKNIAFANVVDEPTLSIASPTINNFFNTNIPLTRGKYSDIEGNIRQGNFNQASIQINNFSPSTNIESNYKDFYSILKDFLLNGFIAVQENTNLLQIANKCPFTDGAVVYDARALYSAINEKIIVFTDLNCAGPNENGGGHGGRLMSQGTSGLGKENAQYLQYILMPNPASDHLKITSFNTDETVKIRITDLSGKLLLEKDLAIKNHFAILELNLLNGMYLVEVSGENYRENKKIVISK